MPHRRKTKNNFCPQLKFDSENSFLYLSFVKLHEDFLEVTIETFVTIFVIKYCGIRSIKIR